MNSKGHRAILSLAFAVAGLVGVTSFAAIAADMSPWDDDLQSSARLIAAQSSNKTGTQTFRAGVEDFDQKRRKGNVIALELAQRGVDQAEPSSPSVLAAFLGALVGAALVRRPERVR